MASGFKDKKGKFHPISNSRGLKMKESKSLKPALIRFPSFSAPPENPTVVTKRLEANITFLKKLQEDRKKLEEDIESKPESEFYSERHDEIKMLKSEIKDLASDIKHDYKKLDDHHREILPQDVKNELRLL